MLASHFIFISLDFRRKISRSVRIEFSVARRKEARSGRLFEDDRVLARRVVAEIREIELSEGERRGKDQDRGERSRGSKGACPWSEGPGHVPSPTRCMFCNLIMDLLVPVLAPLRLF